jgi:hypothetical protein
MKFTASRFLKEHLLFDDVTYLMVSFAKFMGGRNALSQCNVADVHCGDGSSTNLLVGK